MTVKECLHKVLDDLPDERLKQVLDFAEFLSWQQERAELSQMALNGLAKAYSDDEPEYTMADIKPGNLR
ncbi:MAG TPA: hypothetical protein VHR72_14335 [Gemmataceae bacterium]|nr:hypothetical protein [Gemmataceae bacterium]